MPSRRASKASPSQGTSVRFNGCSNYPAWELAEALWTSDKLNLAGYDCMQPRYNILFRHIGTELPPLCRDQGVGVIAYYPLAGSFLTGRHQPGQVRHPLWPGQRWPAVPPALLAGGPVRRRPGSEAGH